MAKPDKEFLIHDLLKMMYKNGASDLHIKAGSPAVFRIDGRLVKSSFLVKDHKHSKDLIYSTLKEDQIAKLEKELDLDYAFELTGICRFRVNAFFQVGTVSASFRTVPHLIPSISELRLPEVTREIAEFPNGLVLVCGPTGCGKSTTLAAVINYINYTKTCRIITIEDPIEYKYKDKLSMIIQREVGRDTKQFSTALRETLRQDPDVILIGEMRDLETISLALTAAETGHLVFATLHTQNAAKNIDRIIDVFPPIQQQQIRVQVSQTLRAVISQALVPKIDGPGRVPAVEVLLVNSAVRNLIREQKTYQIRSVLQTNTRFGMQTLDYALGELVARGMIAIDEAFSRAESFEEVRESVSYFKQKEQRYAQKMATGTYGKPQRL